MRSRELGIGIGELDTGRDDAITDVAGIRVGQSTVIEGDDVRTGVTVIVPPETPLFAGCHRLDVNGVPVGERIGERIPTPTYPPGAGSIIGIVATDAPLLPHQCARLAQRAALGVARMGGLGENSSGDLFLAFASGNRGLGETEQT